MLSGESRKGLIIIYGGFNLPNKNAASHRAINLARALATLNYNVKILGYILDTNKLIPLQQSHLCEKGIEMYAGKYPKNIIEWTNHYFFSGLSLLKLNSKYNSKVILYNSTIPTVLFALLIFKRKNIILDNTEFFQITENITFMKVVKYLDCLFRENISKKLIPRSINISTYLDRRKSKKSIIIPPLIDINDFMWLSDIRPEDKSTKIKLLYAGDIGDSKDNIEEIIQFLKLQQNPNISLIVAGISVSQFVVKYGLPVLNNLEFNIEFLGRISHEEVIVLTKSADYSIFIRADNLVTKAGFPTKFVESLACGTPVITNLTSDIENHITKIEGCLVVNRPFRKLKLKKKTTVSLEASQNYAFKNFSFDSFLPIIEVLL